MTLLFWSFPPKLLTFLSPPFPHSFRNLTPLMCTLLKSTVFWKLVRQSCLRQSSWEEPPPPLPPLALSHLSYIPQVSFLGTVTIYFMLSSVCFVWNISHSVLVWFLLKRNIFSAILWNPFFKIILQGGRQKNNSSLLQCINIVQMHWSQTVLQAIFVLVWYICGWPVCIYEGVSACLS